MALSVLLLFACHGRCGTITISGTQATNWEEEDYNGDWYEACGVERGTWGSWDLYGEGTAQLFFDAGAPGDRSWQGIDVTVEGAVPLDAFAPGAVLGPGEFAAWAYLNPGVDLVYDAAGLSEGSLEILSGDEEDPCSYEDGPTWRLAWDFLLSNADGAEYRVEGADRVRFSTFLSESCP